VGRVVVIDDVETGDCDFGGVFFFVVIVRGAGRVVVGAARDVPRCGRPEGADAVVDLDRVDAEVFGPEPFHFFV